MLSSSLASISRRAAAKSSSCTKTATRAFSQSAAFDNLTDLSSGKTIGDVHARQVIDSRGNPTVEVAVQLSGSSEWHTASVPSGASTGIYEAVELRDGGAAYGGKGVMTAVANAKGPLADVVKGMDPAKMGEIDRAMVNLDGTPNKGKMGANAILGVSLAVAKAAAAARGVPLWQHFLELTGKSASDAVLPVPSFNVINGGSHAGNRLAMQEFMVLPTGAPTFSEAMRQGCEIYHSLKSVIKDKYGKDGTNVGDEGGFAPNVQDNEEGLVVLMEAIEKAGCASSVVLGMDVAASEFLTKDGKYDLDWKGPSPMEVSGQELVDTYQAWAKDYPIVSIEDPFDQDDWDNYGKLMDATDGGKSMQIVGDDLLVTNPERIATAIEKGSCNALLLKVNQIGSVSESIEAVRMSKEVGWGVMTSHRSGETEDHYIADLAVGLRTGQIKTGAPCRSERLSKYNQLLRIEEAIGSGARYAGQDFRLP